MSRRQLAANGFSLPEVMVSSFFVVLFGLLLHEFHRGALRSVRTQEEISQAHDSARVVIEVMTHELRLAGYSAAGQSLTGLSVATPERIEIQCDLDGDGDTDDANEVIDYRYDGTREAVMRATGGGTPQPMLDRVPSGGFTLRYLDRDAIELPGDLDATARQRVRRVEISLAVTYVSPDPALSARVLRHTANVELRNRAL